MTRKLVLCTIISLMVCACWRDNQIENIFLKNESNFEIIIKFTKNSKIINDSLKSNGGNIWIAENRFAHYYPDSLILKYLSTIKITRIDIANLLVGGNEEYVVLFYFKEGYSSIAWKSTDKLTMPLRYYIKKQINSQWFLVNFD